MKSVFTTAALLLLSLAASSAIAQEPKSLKNQILGTWEFVIAEITAPDGSKSLPFGGKPKGIVIFTADGYFAQVHIASRFRRLFPIIG